MYQFDRKKYEERMKWFVHDRFGMFIHFGLYSLLGRGCLVQETERFQDEEYTPYAKDFNPAPNCPREWARLAKKAGMNYVVLTAKHHEGYCLFDSQYTDYKITNSPYGKDLIREYVEACREEGLKVGLYYSLLDWHHDDYPHYGNSRHPQGNDPAFPNDDRDFDRYLTYMHNQVRELCTNYGKIDIMWFDFSYDDINGEDWRATELVTMVRELQPGIIIDNRLETSAAKKDSMSLGKPTPYHGDFCCPEQVIPPDGMKDVNGNDLIWESCVTINNHWSYAKDDHFFKSTPMLIKKLVEIVSKGGNLLLDVGPDANGYIPEKSVKALEEIGKWMEKNKDSIIGCGKSELPKPDWGRITQNGKDLYLHVYENTVGPLPLHGVSREEIKCIRELASGSEVRISDAWVTIGLDADYAFIDLGEDPDLPDPIDTVLKVTLK